MFLVVPSEIRLRTAILPRGVQSHAARLEVNTTLTGVLHLEGNEIGVAGAEALAGALAQNAALRALQLEANDLHDAGAAAVARGLAANKTLTCLHLGSPGCSVGFPILSI